MAKNEEKLTRIFNLSENDLPGKISFGLHNLILEGVLCPIDTVLNRISARWWGIQLGNKTKFYGKTHFVRVPRSVIRIGESCRFRSTLKSNLIGLNHPCLISTQGYGAKILIGNKCGFSGTAIAARELIEIGDNTLCGANVTITDFDWHQVNPKLRQSNKDGAIGIPIRIGQNVWIGMNSIVLKGVKIGDNSVIAAGSVVTHSIPCNSLAAGVPAKVIERLDK